jgi:hypothetical protein
VESEVRDSERCDDEEMEIAELVEVVVQVEE